MFFLTDIIKLINKRRDKIATQISPFLKLTDVGLVDVPNGKNVDLIIE